MNKNFVQDITTLKQDVATLEESVADIDERVTALEEGSATTLYLNTYRYVSVADISDSNLEFKGVIKMLCDSNSEFDYSYYKIVSITGCLYVQGDYFGMANYYTTYNDDSEYVNITCIKNDGTEEEVITINLANYDDFETIEL